MCTHRSVHIEQWFVNTFLMGSPHFDGKQEMPPLAIPYALGIIICQKEGEEGIFRKFTPHRSLYPLPSKGNNDIL
jgi:hypothetical protein